jgi:hypothetical protein
VPVGQDAGEPDYLTLLSEMCDDFDRFQQRENYTLNQQVRNPAQATLLCGLNSHAHYMVRRCLPLLAESPIAVVPIVRLVFECGVMAQWLRWVPGSELSLTEERRRVMKALTGDLRRSQTPHYREAATAAAQHGVFTKWPELSDAPPANAAKFEAICRAFEAESDLYSNYRFLCGYTHAGVDLANVWVVLDDAATARVRVRHEPAPLLSVASVGGIAVLALGWASRAVDDLVGESPRSDFLDNVEQRTQFATRLRIKETVQVVT